MANVSSSNGLEKYPKLRFKGFSEPWNTVRIGDVYAERSERGAEDMELLSVTMNDGVKMRSDIEGKDNSSEDKSNYKIVRAGDMVYNSMRMWQGANGISPWDGIVSPAYTVLKPRMPISNGFFAALFKTHRLINEFRKNSQGMTSDTWNLKYPQFETIKTCIPALAEQEKIADFLMALDQRIEKQRSLVEHLKKYKRGAIEAIFNRTISFASNTGDSWKEFRLGEFARRITRKNGQTTDIPLTISAQYGLIDQREFFSKTVASSDMSGYYLLHKGEFAYNRSTSSEYPFGSIKRLDKYDKGAVSTLYLCFDANEEIMDSDFIMWYFESSRWHNGVREICAEGARNHGLLNVPTAGFFDTVHYLPSNKAEQKRIAAFLSTIDERYTRAFSELEELNNLKKGLYQRLFI